MDDRSNSEMLRGFGDGLTDGQTFVIVELLSQLIELLLRLKMAAYRPLKRCLWSKVELVDAL